MGTSKPYSQLSGAFDFVKNILFIPLWHLQRFVHRDPNLWAFGSWNGVRYSDNARVFYEYVLEHHPEIKAVWLTYSREIAERLEREGRPVALMDTRQGRRLLMHASTFFYVEGWNDADPHYLNGIRIFNLWHGMPLKQIGDDQMRYERRMTLWKRFKTAIRRVVVPFEFVKGETLSTSPFFTPFLSSAFQMTPDKIWEVGTPRNDRFFGATKDRLIEQLDRTYDHPFKVLYMPTFRDSYTRSGHAFDPFAEAGFDAKALCEVLEQKNMVFLYKGHFCDAANRGIEDGGRLRTITDDDYDDQYAFIKDVDLLITDYSSIYFDFLLTRRPMLLFPFDEEAYCAQSRPFYFDYKLMEAERVYSWAELVQALKTHRFAPPTEAEVSRFHKYTDGQACQRLMERLLQQKK